MPLIIFIDALPHSFVDETNILMGRKLNYSLLIPNIGYSSNLHWQLLENVYPDDLGSFTDWNLSDETSKKILVLAKIFAFTEKLPIFSLLIKKFFDKILPGTKFANIPFETRKHFSNMSKYLLENPGYLLSKREYKDFSYVFETGLKTFEECLGDLKESINSNKKIFSVFNYCDRIGHLYGRTSRYDSIIKEHTEKILDLVEIYQKKNPDEKVLIFSDHGMSNVTKSVNPDLEKRFGKQSETNFIYFCDSAILRVWTSEKKKEIGDYLKTLDYGELLDDNLRKKYGVTSKTFGDFIFILYDGYEFKPNYFGHGLRTKVKGLHGYYPESKDQNAVMISNCKLDDRYTYKDFYKFYMRRIMNFSDN